MVQYIDKLYDWISSMENGIKVLNTALSDTEHAIYPTRRDLSACHAFIASEWGVDVPFLLQKMRNLNGSIDNFAYQLLQVTPEASLTGKYLEGDLGTCGNCSNMRARPCFPKPGTRIGDFIQPFVQYTACMRLLEVVFTHWVPGVLRKRTSFIMFMMSFIKGKHK